MLETERFAAVADGVGYMAKRILEAKTRIYHVSLSPPIPRTHSTSSLVEDAVRKVAWEKSVDYRYLVNFEDTARKERVDQILSDPRAKSYKVRPIELGKAAYHMLNYMVFDDDDVVVSIPQVGGPSQITVMRNPDVVAGFKGFFEKQWAAGVDYSLGA